MSALAPAPASGGAERQRRCASLVAALLVLVGWCAAGLVRETDHTWRSLAWGRTADLSPRFWRPGFDEPRELEALLEALSPSLPRGAEVHFATDPAFAAETQIALLWAAYLRPEFDWRLVADLPAEARREWVIAWRAEWPDARYERVAGGFAGALYRLRR